MTSQREWIDKNYSKWRVIRDNATKNWRLKNRKRYLAAQASKVAARKGNKGKCKPAWVDRKALIEFYMNRPEGMHVDHIVPLNSDFVCGLHVPWNLQYLSPQHNLRKGNQFFGVHNMVSPYHDDSALRKDEP